MQFCKEYVDKDAPFDFEVIREWGFKRCPLQKVDEAAVWWLKSYALFDCGILPVNSGWLNLSNKFIEIMLYVKSEVNEKIKNDGEQSRNNPNPK